MKITKAKLKQIIKEELSRVLDENYFPNPLKGKSCEERWALLGQWKKRHSYSPDELKTTETNLVRDCGERSKSVKESRRPSEGDNRYVSKSSRNMALRRGDVDIPDDYRDVAIGTSNKKDEKELPDDRYRVGPAGMALKFDEGLLGTAKSKVKTKAAEIVFGALSDRLGQLNATKGADLVLALMKRLGAEKEVFAMLRSKLGAGPEKGGGSEADELGTTAVTGDEEDETVV